MFGIDDIVEGMLGGTVWGVALVAGGAVVAVAGPRAKPLAKQAIKGYFAATHRVREFAAEATEQVQDLYAEAKYEYESQLDSAEEAPAEEPRRTRRAQPKVDELPA